MSNTILRITRRNTSRSPTVETVRDIRLLEQDAPDAGYKGDRKTVVRLLNEGLEAEIVSVLGYRRHWRMATEAHAGSVAAQFLEHAGEKQSHADLLAEHIVQLGGEVELDLEQICRHRHARFVEEKDLNGMIREDLGAERNAIDGYGEMIRFLAAGFPATRHMVEGIRAAEEGRVDDLTSLLLARSV